jgi:hypothetical protein
MKAFVRHFHKEFLQILQASIRITIRSTCTNAHFNCEPARANKSPKKHVPCHRVFIATNIASFLKDIL